MLATAEPAHRWADMTAPSRPGLETKTGDQEINLQARTRPTDVSEQRQQNGARRGFRGSGFALGLGLFAVGSLCNSGGWSSCSSQATNVERGRLCKQHECSERHGESNNLTWRGVSRRQPSGGKGAVLGGVHSAARTRQLRHCEERSRHVSTKKRAEQTHPGSAAARRVARQ